MRYYNDSSRFSQLDLQTSRCHNPPPPNPSRPSQGAAYPLKSAIKLNPAPSINQIYSGVIGIDGNRMRFSFSDWKTILVLKTLGTEIR